MVIPNIWLFVLVAGCLNFGQTNADEPPLERPNFAGEDLSGIDLQELTLVGANLTGANLDEATGLVGADLSDAILTNASLQNVDLSGALLYGAQLNGANLEGANLSGAILTNYPEFGIVRAANLAGAHLKNVNLSYADLTGANLINANFYGSVPAGSKPCDTSGGFTKDCASAAYAILDNTHLTGAFLYGVDFSHASLEGTHFDHAILVGANFAGATVAKDPNTGAGSGFHAAYLQGAYFRSTIMIGITLQHAFVDFRRRGNKVLIRLPGSHTVFRGSKSPGQAKCVLAKYKNPTIVPEEQASLVCPDGSLADMNSPVGCGPVPNGHWKSPVLLAHAAPPGSYLKKATFKDRPRTRICKRPDPNW